METEKREEGCSCGRASGGDRFFLRLETAAAASLLEEIFTTPKPGLVDASDNGAHRDMDCVTFIRSTGAIVPYFRRMAETAAADAGKRAGAGELPPASPALFPGIREIGKCAEKAMFEATGGVNTHKGMIFSVGILSSAAGYLYGLGKRSGVTAEEILAAGGRLCKSSVEGDFVREIAEAPAGADKGRDLTHGEVLFRRYGERGIRGEAEEGFPVLRDVALPILREKTAAGVPDNERNIDALLAVMTCLHDTNVIHRGSPEALTWLMDKARRILDAGGAEEDGGIGRVRELNRECIKRNLSPGGAADMLACGLYLMRLENLFAEEFDGRKTEGSEPGDTEEKLQSFYGKTSRVGAARPDLQ